MTSILKRRFRVNIFFTFRVFFCISTCNIRRYERGFFVKQDHTYFELKTKSVEVDQLKGLKHRGKTVVSWSLSPDEVISKEEAGSPSLKNRIIAAKKVYEWGYPIGFHFDPIIYTSNWEILYNEMLHQISYYIPSDAVKWISIGTLRFNPVLKHVMENRFLYTKIMYGELVVGFDGKLRYSDNIRLHIYRSISDIIKLYYPDTYIYLCMESPSIWKEWLR